MIILAVTWVSSLRCHAATCFRHGFKVALHSIDSNRDTVDKRERLRVFGQNWRKHAGDNVSK